MIKNHLKVAFRRLLRHKLYAVINITGLVLGISCCLLIGLYLRFEWEYDRHHENAERIFRVTSERVVGGSIEKLANAPFPTGPALAAHFPEIIESARLLKATNGASIAAADQLLSEEFFFFTDPSLVKVFTFEFISGHPESALQKPNSVVITERIAKKYFGDESALGQTLKAALLGKSADLEVTGIVKNTPVNAHFTYDFLVPFESELNGWNEGQSRWDSGILGAWTYILLSDKGDAATLQGKLAVFAQTHVPESVRGRLAFALQPLTDIHLHSHLVGELGANGSLIYVYLFAGVAALVLLIACINFVNLSTAQAIRRAREVGVRKTFGASRSQIIRQYLSETFAYSLIALILAVGLVEALLPFFNALISKPLPQGILSSWYLIGILLGIWLLTGFLAGLYPAYFLASFRLTKAIKGRTTGFRASKLFLRQGMIIGQFAASMVLLVTFWTVFDQLQYIKNKELGFAKEHLLVITGRSGVSFEAFKHELKQSSTILEVTVTARVPGGRHLATSLITPEGRDLSAQLRVPFLNVENDFLKTFQLVLIEGRDFTQQNQNTIIINEAARTAFGWETGAIGKKVIQTSRGTEQAWEVVGVVKDMHFESLHTQVKPLILAGGINFGSRIIVRIAHDNVSESIAYLQQTWARLSPNVPLDFYFLDDDINQLYKQEERLSKLIQGFTFLAMFISCIGLFGLIAFATEQRTKEIGIRKVLGATVPDIVLLLSKQFVALVGLALILAVPLAYTVAYRWLNLFAYRVEVSSFTVVGAGAVILVIALITVASRSMRVALANPVEALQSD